MEEVPLKWEVRDQVTRINPKWEDIYEYSYFVINKIGLKTSSAQHIYKIPGQSKVYISSKPWRYANKTWNTYFRAYGNGIYRAVHRL